MYLCPCFEAGRSQSPLQAPAREAKAEPHFPTQLEKFAEQAAEITCSSASPSQRLEAGGPGAVAAARRAPRAGPRRPCLPAPGRARHVLPAVWVPLLLRTPGKRAPRGRWKASRPAARSRFPAPRPRATHPSRPTPGRAEALRQSHGQGQPFPLCLSSTPYGLCLRLRPGEPPRDQGRCGTGGRAPCAALETSREGVTTPDQDGLGPTWPGEARRKSSPRKGMRGPPWMAVAPGAWGARSRSRRRAGGRRPGSRPSSRLVSLPQFLMTTNSLSTCCESGARTLADSGTAASAQAPVYCPVYESRLLATARHELNSAAALGVYGSPYGSSQGYSNYVTYGSEASAFYSLVREGADHKRLPATPGPQPRCAKLAFPELWRQGASPGSRALGTGEAGLGSLGLSTSEPGPSDSTRARVGCPGRRDLFSALC